MAHPWKIVRTDTGEAYVRRATINGWKNEAFFYAPFAEQHARRYVKSWEPKKRTRGK